METLWKTWNKKEKREKGRVILALKGKSIWAKIKVVILTMQNPFGGSGIQMETRRVWLKMEYYTPSRIKKRLYFFSISHLIYIFIYLCHNRGSRCVKLHPPLPFWGRMCKMLLGFNICTYRKLHDRFIHESLWKRLHVCKPNTHFQNYS